jgi:hypothetical protein
MGNMGGSNGNVGGGKPELDAYAFVDGSATPPVVTKGRNVSSITDDGVGEFSLNFTTALASANYTWVGTAISPSGNTNSITVMGKGNVTTTVSLLPLRLNYANGVDADVKFNVIVTGA